VAWYGGAGGCSSPGWWRAIDTMLLMQLRRLGGGELRVFIDLVERAT
jgi:hypothetical protein